MLAGIPSARKSAWQDPEFKKTDNTPDWTDISISSYKNASIYWNPPVEKVAECRDAMGNAIVTSILGGDVKEACNNAARSINDIISISK